MQNIEKIQTAIKFAIKTHEVYQQQKRKGKDIAYITHPLTVGIILAKIDSSDDVIIAGILHDTTEDSIPEKKVTKNMIAKRFGNNVANIVKNVSEPDKSLPWEVRKKSALKHIPNLSNDSLLVKSADVLSNVFELINDFQKQGDVVFERFNAPKDRIIKNYIDVIHAIEKQWSENPLLENLLQLKTKLNKMNTGK